MLKSTQIIHIEVGHRCLKTKQSFGPRAIAELRKQVNSELSKDVSFDIVVTQNLPSNIEWRRHRGDRPAHSEEARFLTNEIEGTEFFGGGNIGPRSNDKLISL